MKKTLNILFGIFFGLSILLALILPTFLTDNGSDDALTTQLSFSFWMSIVIPVLFFELFTFSAIKAMVQNHKAKKLIVLQAFVIVFCIVGILFFLLIGPTAKFLFMGLEYAALLCYVPFVKDNFEKV